MSESALLELGRIERAHGLKGEVTVGFVTNMIEARTAPGAVLFARDADGGAGAALEVVTARPHKGKWLIVFAGHESREAAENLRGTTLVAPPLDEAEAEGEVFLHELIDRRLVDQHGTDHGPVVSVVENPASDLLELADGALVPLSFYVDHDVDVVRVDVPVGLLDPEGAEVVPDGGSGER